MAYNYVELGSLITPSKTVRCGDGVYPVLSMTMHNGLVFQDEKFKKVIASKDTSDYKVVYRNQLVISFPIDEGVLAAQRITDAGIVSPAYGIWDINQSKILPEFLEYALRCDRAIQYYKAKLRGSTARRRTIPTPTLLAFMVPLPCLEEQKMVIDRIHRARLVIENRKEQMNKLDDLIKARFVELFGDPISNSKNLETKSLNEIMILKAGDLCRLVDACSNSDDIKCGPFGTQLGKDEYTEEGVSVWEIPQINSEFKTLPTHFVTEEKAAALNAYSIIPGDIAMSRKGNVGRCAVFPATFENGIIHSDVLRIRLDKAKVLPEFMMRQLHYSGDIQHQIELVSSGAIMAGINVTKLKQIYVYLPPIDLQGKFVEFIAQVDKSKAVIQKSLEEAQLLFDSLMQQYFG